MATGWMIGVLVEPPGGTAPLRCYFAVGQEDRSKAEWTAVDRAMGFGAIASSPVDGIEPVQALAELSAHMMHAKGLDAGEVRALGSRWPRTWMMKR